MLNNLSFQNAWCSEPVLNNKETLLILPDRFSPSFFSFELKCWELRWRSCSSFFSVCFNIISVLIADKNRQPLLSFMLSIHSWPEENVKNKNICYDKRIIMMVIFHESSLKVSRVLFSSFLLEDRRGFWAW